MLTNSRCYCIFNETVFERENMSTLQKEIAENIYNVGLCITADAKAKQAQEDYALGYFSDSRPELYKAWMDAIQAANKLRGEISGQI